MCSLMVVLREKSFFAECCNDWRVLHDLQDVSVCDGCVMGKLILYYSVGISVFHW